ncbi:MAG: hypothetical protein KGZ58_12075, partial [Ignavibacteriales bacterium]|nr:hypothetical protein [Ignavibacteriales bacterium]
MKQSFFNLVLALYTFFIFSYNADGQSLPTITCPDNITVNSSTGFIYVGERGGSVSKISTSGTRTVLAGVSSADGVVFDNFNSILVSRFDGSGTTIVRVHRTTGAQTNIVTLGGAAQGMSVDG